MAETSKSKERRLQEGFYEKYIKGYGIDIGVGRIDTFDGADPIALENCVHHDKDTCDAVTMNVFEDETFDYVYGSHILEHVNDPVTAIKNWYRICKTGGYVIIAVPDRDSYERQEVLPSRWNADHKFFITENNSYPPNTYSLKWLLREALENLPYEVEYIKTINTCTNTHLKHEHGDREYQIEAVIKKTQ